jgi:hypothetical protein
MLGVQLNIVTSTFHCLAGPFAALHDFMYKYGIFQQYNALLIGPKLSRTDSKSILESSDKWCGHHIHLT